MPVQNEAIKPFTFTEIIDESSIRKDLAINAGMHIIDNHYGMLTISGDKDAWILYRNYCAAYSKEINKEFMQQHRVLDSPY